MKLRCHRAFGNFTPGDEVEVPDGAVYDNHYFEAPEPEIQVAPSAASEKEAVIEPAPDAPKEEGK